MGFDFNVLDREGLIEPPRYGSSEAECDRWFEASWQETGWYSTSYSGDLICEVTRILRLTGVWDEMDPGERPMDESGDKWHMFYSQRSSNPFRVPSFKFTSGSSGFIITPRECKSIAYALRGSDKQYIHDFARFCEFAATHCGFSID